MISLQGIRLAFEWTVAATVAASILAVLIGGIQWAFRRRLGATWRFGLWMLVLVRLLVPVLPQSTVSLFNVQRLWSPPANLKSTSASVVPSILRSPGGKLLNSEKIQSARISDEPPYPATFSNRDLIACVWLGGVALCLLRLMGASVWLRVRLARDRSALDSRCNAILASIKGGTGPKPRVVETSLVNVPGLHGCWRPAILLPKWVASQLTDLELEHIFRHEMAHIKRGDLFTNLLMSIAAGLHWFNPVVWIVFRRMRIERELACDAIVLEFAGASGAKAYGQTLLKMLSGLRFNIIRPGVIGMLEEKESALSRIAQVATFKPNSKSVWGLRSFLFLAIASIGLTDASEKNMVNVSDASIAPLITNAATPAITGANRKIKPRKFDKIVLPEFGIPKVLPLQKVLARLSAAVIEADPDHVGIAFMIRSRTSIGHPLLDDYLVQIDPAVKNANLATICEAISSPKAGGEKHGAIAITYTIEKDAVTFFEADLYNIEFVVDDLSAGKQLCKFFLDKGIDVFGHPIVADNFLGTRIEFSKRGIFFKTGKLTARGIAREIEQAAAIIEERAAANLPVPGLSKSTPIVDAYRVPAPAASLWSISMAGKDLTLLQTVPGAPSAPASQFPESGVYQSLPYSGYVIVPNSNVDSLMIIGPRTVDIDPMPVMNPSPELELIPRFKADPQLLLHSSR
jgi:beta-lactamase regulating signal transducer with metallopeptidase domain